MPLRQTELYTLADELRAIATMGLLYAVNDYDRDRYQRLLARSLELAASLDERPVEDLVREHHQSNWNHVSPAAGAEGAVYRDGKLLLIQRRDNGLWAIPGGMVEVGETLAQSAERELWEEAGVRGKATRLLGIFDSRIWQNATKRQFYGAVFEVDAGDAVPAAGPEAMDAGFFGEQDCPPLSPGHTLRVPLLFRILRGEVAAPYFDRT